MPSRHCRNHPGPERPNESHGHDSWDEIVFTEPPPIPYYQLPMHPYAGAQHNTRVHHNLPPVPMNPDMNMGIDPQELQMHMDMLSNMPMRNAGQLSLHHLEGVEYYPGGHSNQHAAQQNYTSLHSRYVAPRINGGMPALPAINTGSTSAHPPQGARQYTGEHPAMQYAGPSPFSSRQYEGATYSNGVQPANPAVQNGRRSSHPHQGATHHNGVLPTHIAMQHAGTPPSSSHQHYRATHHTGTLPAHMAMRYASVSLSSSIPHQGTLRYTSVRSGHTSSSASHMQVTSMHRNSNEDLVGMAAMASHMALHGVRAAAPQLDDEVDAEYQDWQRAQEQLVAAGVTTA